MNIAYSLLDIRFKIKCRRRRSRRQNVAYNVDELIFKEIKTNSGKLKACRNLHSAFGSFDLNKFLIDEYLKYKLVVASLSR